MNFVFRCDSSTLIGSGHLMRCLSLAEQVRKAGHVAHFVCAPLVGSMHKIVEHNQFPLCVLSAPNLTEKQDAEEVSIYIKKLTGSVIVVIDHYALGLSWEKIFAKNHKVIVIDDLIRQHDCDILIDSNYRCDYEGLYKNKVPSRCRMFLGPYYSFLRDEFQNIDVIGRQKNQVFVFFGGTDPSNETLRFVNALEDASVNGSFFVVVISRAHAHLNSLNKLAVSPNYRIEVQPPSISNLLKESKLYFGSGGTITWERMFLGVPGVVVSVADNQTKIAEDLGKDGQQIYLGESSSVNYGDAIELCSQLLHDNQWLHETSDRNRKLVQRIQIDDVFKVLGVVSLRLATVEDAQFLYELRNDETVRSVSISNTMFSYESHVAWLQKRISSEVPLYIVLYKGERAGQVRIDSDFTISIAIDSRFRGLGLASEAIEVALNRFSDMRHLQRTRYTAIIKDQNTGSIRSFEKAGFKLDEEVEIQGEKFLKYYLEK
nr:UDP-2,4-diacetamido-2,4,6-trideoxy-beta-L-altropyranose hydrolase [uncultured Bdellovibrio sp.]